MSDGAPVRTALYDEHVALEANLVDFHGFELPIWYSSIKEEHLATRATAGLFDVSHMGSFRFSGADVKGWLEGLATQRVTAIAPPRCAYTHFLDDDGLLIDDMIFAVVSDTEILGVPNASMIDVMWTWFTSHLPENGSIQLENLSDATSIMALQGPNAKSILSDVLGESNHVGRFKWQAIGGNALSITGWLQGTGYTGEAGYEIFVPNEDAPRLWRALINAGAVPVGLGARDSLRLEAGLCLYGQDIDTKSSPVAAGLKWAMHKSRLSKGQKEGSFPGANTILSEIKNGSEYKLAGFVPLGKAPIRANTQLFDNGTSSVPIGRITSGLFSPTQKHPIAVGYIKSEFSHLGNRVNAQVRGKLLEIEVTSLPFVKKNFKKN